MQLPQYIYGLLAPSLVAARFSYTPQHPLTTTSAVDPPLLGYGTWNLHNATEAVSVALQVGYEHLDCAAAYENEKEVGKGIKEGLSKTGKERENIWITSKLFNNDHGRENVEHAIDKTLTDLGLDYLDLYLMHWPIASRGGINVIEFMDTWRGMERLVALNKTRYIGVANFNPYQLSHLLLHSHITPAVHQLEAHPYLQQSEFLQFNNDRGIHVTAYSPLGNLNPLYSQNVTTILKNEVITKIAKKRNCTNAQVVLAWGMARGTSVIPKSQHADRIKENYDSLKCTLHEEDFEDIEEISEHIVKRFNKLGKQFGLKLFQGLEDSDD